MKKILCLIFTFLLCITSIFGKDTKREFRGIWIATVDNINWPSKKGLSVEDQKKEYIDILNEIKSLNMNAIIMQVRPTADRFYKYPSSEPWSQYITGESGKNPGYDPLAFFIEEAHKRNIEFHAWFNPYRITLKKGEPIPKEHIARKHPNWIIEYAGRYYYDPGNPQAREFTENVIVDVVKHYDIDGVHMDDYFYPYPVLGKNRKVLHFNDDKSFAKYGKGMERGNWRRENTNAFVKELSHKIKKTKPYVKFGISPFGVWRNNDKDPTGSKTRAGAENYDTLYADTRVWIKNNWIDYIVPQIYWDFNLRVAPYKTLVDWWINEVKGSKVNLYIGQAAYKLGGTKAWRNKNELINQIKYNRSTGKVQGNIFFGYDKINKNVMDIKNSLKNKVYENIVLPNRTPWIDTVAPKKVTHLSGKKVSKGILLNWKDFPKNYTDYYVIYRSENKNFSKDLNKNIIDTVKRKYGEKYLDTRVIKGKSYYYMIAPVDRVHNQGEQSKTFKINY
ncbi:family 10 glycosylhydrolase [uncultured Cetobacterium sp.]|uniref:glycoside hydrolase family 10 protein n=1 Tax=uncultured Cetobacterium sp. TaxID=527638 RepID=UPI0026222A6B|nr:family 10 glycosylhydrolase [uncultured Cetobacterium sp.]